MQSARESRYLDNWRAGFQEQFVGRLVPGVRILDVGSGRKPAIPVQLRPENCTYVGLDISSEELTLAPESSYDHHVVADLTELQTTLVGKFDLALSWQVLEHVSPLDLAVENTRQYLADGGMFVSMLAGRNAHFSILNRVVPEPLGKFAMQRLLRREPDTVFRAHYDSCTFDELEAAFSSWSDVTVLPRYRGADYFRFSNLLSSAYLKYEDWIARNEKRNLATHYVVVAVK